jgi:SM-20-related protein
MSGVGMRGNRWCRFEQFLAPGELVALRERVLSLESSFSPSTTTTGDTGHRRSRLLLSIPAPFDIILRQRLESAWPLVAASLGFPRFTLAQIVAQVTAHAGGDYYRVHDDNGQPSIRRRTVSFAYYFHDEPREFAGGELALLDEVHPPELISPAGNTIVFFPSSSRHEVRPVAGGADLASARLAVNGWLYR